MTNQSIVLCSIYNPCHYGSEPVFTIQNILNVHYLDQSTLKPGLVFLSYSKGEFGPDYNNPQPNETYKYLRNLKWDDAAKERVQRDMDEATHYEQYCIESGGLVVGSYFDLVCSIHILVSVAAV